MRKRLFISLLLLCSGGVINAQNPSCPANLIYLDGGNFIRAYDPSQPVSINNPATLSIPAFGSGLALLPNISGPGPSPTFYSTSGGNYHYWNGNNWVNTGHSTGNSAAINLAGCPTLVYNLVGSTGAVYVYNGSGNGSLLTTISNFNGNGPYDLAADCNCNFYVLNTNAPNQALTMYNSSGQVLCTYTLQGLPNSTSGTGLAIIGNDIFVRNAGFYIGHINGSVINFTSVPSFTTAAGDFASCASCYSTTPLTGAAIGGNTLLTCSNPTTSFFVTSTLNPVSYSWAGPGIVSATTGSAIILNAAGVYSCTLSNTACNPSQITLTLAAQSNVIAIPAIISPSGSVCSVNNQSVSLSIVQNNPNHTVSWAGPGLNNISGTNSVTVFNTGSYTVQVKDPSTGCSAQDVVNVAQRPIVSMTLSTPSVCAMGYNGSPINLSITAGGATNYTLLTSSNAQPIPVTANLFNVLSNMISGNMSAIATGTLIGQTGFCADTATTAFSIIANPAVSLSSSVISICPGGSATVSANGATSYTWTGPAGLNSYSLATVIAQPLVSSVYSVFGTSGGCNSIMGSFSLNVQPFPTLSITPSSATVCSGSSVLLSKLGTATTFSWYPVNKVSQPFAPNVTAYPQGVTVFTLVGALNGCSAAATATVHTVAPPVVNVSVSQPTMCFSNYNGSPNTVTISAGGATTYTLLSGPNGSVTFSNGPFMQLTPAGTPASIPTVIQTTLLAVTGVCTVVKTQSIVIIPNPVLTITPPSSNICPGETRAFTAYGADSYNWALPMNYSLTAANSILVSPGMTSFYAVYGTSSGCNSMTKNATAVVFPKPDLDILPPTSTVCAGTSVKLTVIGNATSYQWFPSAGLSNPTATSVLASPMATQQYSVIGTLNSCTNMAVTTVSAIPMPSISLSASTGTVCRGAPLSLYANGATSYKWFPSSILNTTVGAAVIAHPLQNTTFTVQGFNGICTGTASVHVIAVKPPDMTISSTLNEVCLGSKLQLIAHGAQSYTWVPVSSLIHNGNDSIVWVSPKTATNYTVFGSTQFGPVSCHQQLSYYVSVIPIADPKISGNTKICPGEKTTLYASGGNTFKWMPSQGLNITNGSGVVANPTVSTVYTVHVSHNTYCGASSTVAVDVGQLPTVFAGNDTTVNRSESIVLKATGTGTIRWIFGDGIACADCPETQVFPQSNACYIVESTNEFGCKAEDQVCIKLTEDFSVYVPNSFTPNQDGLNDEFLIFGEHISAVSLRVFNRWGSLIFSTEDVSHGWDGTFNGQACKPDVYTFTLSYTGLDRKHYTRTGSITLLR